MVATAYLISEDGRNFAEVEIEENVGGSNYEPRNADISLAVEGSCCYVTLLINNDGNVMLRFVDSAGDCQEHQLT